MNPLAAPFPQFYDLDGSPLDAGYIYIGVVNQNPETQPVQAYWDVAGTQPAPQPIRTTNGFPVRNGNIAQVYVVSDYSLTVRDKKRSLVFYQPVNSGLQSLLASAVGAAMIGYLQPNTGAVVTNVAQVLSEDVSVMRFMTAAQIADTKLSIPLIDQTAAFQAAIDSGVKFIHVPVGKYRIESTIRLRDGTKIIGAGALQSNATTIYFTKNDGTHCFDSDPALFLSAVHMEGMEIFNSVNAAGNVATGDAFHLFGLTNNSSFRDLAIRNFGGSGFAIGKQTTTPGDQTACQNVLFEQCFIISCGGYAFDVTGYVNATWLMCDLNSCATGYYRFTGGTTNQVAINVYGLWVEGTRTWAAKTVFDMIDPQGQMLNIIGGNVTNGNGGTARVVRSTTSSCRLNVVGLTGLGWTYLLEDTPAVETVPFSTPTNYFYNAVARQLVLQSSGPVLDVYQDVGGTVDQRRFRVASSGGNFLMTARADDGTSVRNISGWNFVTGAYTPGVDNNYTLGSAVLRWSVVYAGTGAINTSDGRQKQQVRTLNESEKAVAIALKGMIRAFKFNDAVETKGDNARIHFGVIAQDVETAFKAEGLKAADYGIFCYDEWDDFYTDVTDEEGKVIDRVLTPAGNRYGVRYDQLLAFIISAM